MIEDFIEIFKSISSDLHAKVYNNTSFQSALAVKEFCEKLLSCIYSNDYRMSLDMTPLVVELKEDTKYDGEFILNPVSLGRYLSSGMSRKNNLLKVNLKGIKHNCPTKTFLIDRESELLDFSTKNSDAVYFFLSGYRLSAIQNGNIFYICENVMTTKPIVKIEKGMPISQYKSLIEQHYKDCLDGECQTSYWQNKSKFQLRNSPEIIFQKSLAYYLSTLVTDGFVIEECLNKNTTDRTDITVSAYTQFGLKNYVLEIKWIGKSSSGSGSSITSYDGKTAHSKANEGIKQLNTYLRRDSTAICGHLVVYDARKNKVDISWKGKEDWDARIDQEPSLVSLSTKSASTRAKK